MLNINVSVELRPSDDFKEKDIFHRGYKLCRYGHNTTHSHQGWGRGREYIEDEVSFLTAFWV